MSFALSGANLTDIMTVSAPDEPRDQNLRRLMSAAQDGDRASYDQLLRAITPPIRAFIRSRTKLISRPDIEDIVQDVLLSVHEARQTYDPKRPFFPWLMAITRNRLADRGRRQARLWKNEVASEYPPETFADPESNKLLDTYGDPDALRASMAELPPGQRTALELTKIRGLSLVEASHESGMSIGALKGAVHRALKALRVKLSKGE